MTPDEQKAITGLFGRMSNFSAPQKDREAEVLINQFVGTFSDAPYMLVQSALTQEQALEAATYHLQELKKRARILEEELQQPTASSSFLGRIFAGRSKPVGRN